MADFIPLKVQFGVGPYHLNRFRIVFAPPPGSTAATIAPTLAADFVANFPRYFSSQYASVERTSRQYHGKDTLKFHGYMKVLGIDLAFPHNDWVVQEVVEPATGFTAQTLQRLFDDWDEVKSLPGLIFGIGGAEAILANHRHFLAGRRAWRLDTGRAFGLPDTLLVLETAAIERFSARFFQLGDKIGGLESRIPKIWIANLTNFVRMKGLTVVPQGNEGGGWKSDTTDGVTRVDYVQVKAPDLPSLQAKDEYAKVIALFPHIIDLQAKPPGLWEKLERGPIV